MPVTTQNATISAGGSLSTAVNASSQNSGIRRIIFPAGWTGDAWVTVLMSYDGATYNDLYHSTRQPVVLRVIPGGTIVIEDGLMPPAYYKLRSGSADYPIAQTEERVFTIVLE